jgi:uncharacterized RDD family membrane protein YckC
MSQQLPPPSSPPPSSPPPYAASTQQAWVAPVAGPAPGIAYASGGSRLIAYIVDYILIWVLVIVVSLVLGSVMAAGASADSGGAVAGGALVWFLALFVIMLGYFPWFWTRGGATPGMKLLHIRVVREVDGGGLTGGQAVMRLIGYWVSAVVFYLGFIWILIDAHKQGWHDKIANTVVIESRKS